MNCLFYKQPKLSLKYHKKIIKNRIIKCILSRHIVFSKQRRMKKDFNPNLSSIPFISNK